MQRFIRPAKFLPGQLDRIRGAEFGTVAEVVRGFQGGFDSLEGETLGLRLKDTSLVDGVLYAPGATRHLRRRNRRLPAYASPREIISGALYESWVGNRWFGNWLSDDCLTYRLAEQFGSPVTTTMTTQGHVPDYEALLGIDPHRVEQVHFDELILFRDLSHNDNRQARASELRERLIASVAPIEHHAGVFLLRGDSGMRRVLVNERSIAEKFAIERGFRVLDPSVASVEDIISACAGASVVAGIEGSQLVHGLMLMPPDAALLVIQPPARAVSALKFITDRQGQTYAFVVATGGDDEFSVSWDELAGTLDLIQADG
jgi:capsular polysaccharide biosynthesis protein